LYCRLFENILILVVIIMSRNNNEGFSPNVNLWLDVKSEVEVGIISGQYEAGDRLPSVNEFASLYNIGKTTAQKVLESLCADNTVVNKKGVGYFVRPLVRDRLATAHFEEVKKRISSVAKFGRRRGVSKEDMAMLMAKAYEDISE